MHANYLFGELYTFGKYGWSPGHVGSGGISIRVRQDALPAWPASSREGRAGAAKELGSRRGKRCDLHRRVGACVVVPCCALRCLVGSFENGVQRLAARGRWWGSVLADTEGAGV